MFQFWNIGWIGEPKIQFFDNVYLNLFIKYFMQHTKMEMKNMNKKDISDYPLYILNNL